MAANKSLKTVAGALKVIKSEIAANRPAGAPRTLEEQSKYRAEYDRWEKAQDSWRITVTEVRQKVAAIREELELEREQLEGVPFDLPRDEIPQSIDRKRKELIADLITVNPLIEGYFRMIDEYAKRHGCCEFLDFNAKLFALKCETAETGFKIGVLAGIVFAGCSKDQIDKFERGLTFSLISNAQLVKGDDD